MEEHHEGDRRGHCGIGYAASRYPAWARPNRHADRGHRLAALILRRGDRMRVHQAAAERRYRGGEEPGSKVWAAREGQAGGLRRTGRGVESRAYQCTRGGEAVRGSAHDVPEVGEIS